MRGRAAAAGLVTALTPVAASAAAEGASGFYWEWFNLLLLIAVLVFLTRKPVLAYLEQRREGIQEDIASSERLLADAEGKLEEWSGKVARLETDVAEIRQLTRDRAERERTRILEEAERVAERIRRDAEAAVERELGRARKTLREEASSLAIEMAERMLEQGVTDEDRSRLVDEFVTRIESGGGAAPGSA